MAEESLQDLLDLPVTRQIMEEGVDWDRSILLEDIGIALHLASPEDFWLLLTDRYCRERILMNAADRFGSEATKRIMVDESAFLRASSSIMPSS